MLGSGAGPENVALGFKSEGMQLTSKSNGETTQIEWK